jgi:hypothetical protein
MFILRDKIKYQVQEDGAKENNIFLNGFLTTD